MKFLSSWGTTYEHKVFCLLFKQSVHWSHEAIELYEFRDEYYENAPTNVWKLFNPFSKRKLGYHQLNKKYFTWQWHYLEFLLFICYTNLEPCTKSAGSPKTQISWKKRKIKRIVGIIFSFTTERFINGGRLSEAVMSWTCSVELHIKRSKLLRA